MGFFPRCARVLLIAAALCALHGVAHAHAPLPKRVALSADGSAVALSLPGFGLLLQSAPERPFAYACDALLGVKPSEHIPALAQLGDGTLLLGSPDGLRLLGSDGCPRGELEGALSSAAISALALEPGNDQGVYATATNAGAPGLWQSRDRGRHWMQRAQLATSDPITALVVSARTPAQVYVSAGSATQASVLASSDGGASFVAHAQALPLVLLSADGRASHPLWAMSRDAATVGNRGIAILRAARPEGPWQVMLRVNYYGGFAIDAQSTIWVGDEIGGLYRSDDGGDSFQNLEQDADVACLAAAGDALWACTPGTNKEPALQKIRAATPRSALIALAAVEQLVSCPDRDVTKICSAAWSEWQRDVLQRPMLEADAGAPLAADAGDAASPQALAPDAQPALAPDAQPTSVPSAPPAPEDEPNPAPPPEGGHAACSLAGPVRYGPSGPPLIAALMLVAALGARRRARSRFCATDRSARGHS